MLGATLVILSLIGAALYVAKIGTGFTLLAAPRKALELLIHVVADDYLRHRRDGGG